MEKKTLQDALSYIQCKLVATKDQYNSFGGYPYRSAEGIIASVKPYLNELGLALTFNDDIVMLGDRFYVKATATLTNGKEMVQATAFAREEESKKVMDGSQVTGASSSYARKYALCGLFAIDGEKDADALNTSPEYTQKVKEVKVSQATLDALAEAKKALEACKTTQEVTELWNGTSAELKKTEFRTLVAEKGSQLKSKGL